MWFTVTNVTLLQNVSNSDKYGLLDMRNVIAFFIQSKLFYFYNRIPPEASMR